MYNAWETKYECLCTLIFSMLTQPKDPQIIRNCFVMFSNVNMPV